MGGPSIQAIGCQGKAPMSGAHEVGKARKRLAVITGSGLEGNRQKARRDLVSLLHGASPEARSECATS